MSQGRSFSAGERDAVYRAIFERRDIRSYLPDPVPRDVLWRILTAAHHAPSVGFMQPWNFLVVQSEEKKRAIHAHFLEVNQRAAEVFEDDAKRSYQSLKLQGILDAPLGILVTCDPTRAGEHVLGRFTMPETDVYSTCLTIQNLWLAARAEGVGVGWMSIMEPAVMRVILRVPSHVVPVAYLTLGYPVEFAREPMLSQVGWRKRLELSDLVFLDEWERRDRDFAQAPPRTEAAPKAAASTREVAAAFDPPPAALQRNRNLTKPHGSLGQLESVTLKLCGIQQTAYPRCDAAQLVLFAGDHGVTAQGVSAYKPDTTRKMVYSYLAGGAVVNALARREQLPVHVVDVGVDHDFSEADGLIHRKVRRGTRDLSLAPAMTPDECERAIAAGRDVVQGLSSLDVLLVGEMGIGNSTSAAALTAALLSLSPEQVVGFGTGVSEAGKVHKTRVVARALSLANERDATSLLAQLGGFEIAALVGAMEAAADRGAAVLLDGFITTAAALVAVRRTPRVLPHLLASHSSAEPAHARLLESLGLSPLLSLDMRLGEGSGAVLALGLLRSACAVMREVRTFEEANIERPEV